MEGVAIGVKRGRGSKNIGIFKLALIHEVQADKHTAFQSEIHSCMADPRVQKPDFTCHHLENATLVRVEGFVVILKGYENPEVGCRFITLNKVAVRYNQTVDEASSADHFEVIEFKMLRYQILDVRTKFRMFSRKAFIG